jgi:hypothetical protein
VSGTASVRISPVISGVSRSRHSLAERSYGTTVEPMVGMNWHCFSVVVT